MAVGASAGFSGVTIPQFQRRNETTLESFENSFQLTDEQLSWFASLPTFATIPTCIFGGLMGQAFGRRLSLLLVAPISITSFICQAVAQDVVLLQFGRLLTGLACGLVSAPAAVIKICPSLFPSNSQPMHAEWITAIQIGSETATDF